MTTLIISSIAIQTVTTEIILNTKNNVIAGLLAIDVYCSDCDDADNDCHQCRHEQQQ